MSATVAELEKRLMVLEQEFASLRQLVERSCAEEACTQRGARLLHQARLSQGSFSSGWNKALEVMGIHGEPIGAEQVQQLMAANGVKPEDNEFSRDLIATREE